MNTSQQQLERIVAYLDGELSSEESAQVEQRLATDESFRQELQGAERAWTALDELPMAHVGDDFSRTTMEMVVNAARQDVQARTIALPVQQRKRKTTTVVLATMAVLLGALFFRVLWKNPNRRLLADLPVIQNVDIYTQFQSVQFLQQLHHRLGEDVPLDSVETERVEAKLAEFQLVSAVDRREDWLESLLPAEQVTLRAKFNRFRDLPTQQQTELRDLHQQIEASADREQLLRTMYRYQQWLNELAPSEQFEVRETPDSDRARRIAREMERAAFEQEFKLTPEQLEKLSKHVLPHIMKVVRQRQKAFKQNISRSPSHVRMYYESLSKQEQAQRVFLSALRDSPDRMDAFNEVIVEALPPEMQPAFEKLLPEDKGPIVMGWLMQARRQAMAGRHSSKDGRHGDVSEQELSDFFVKLDPAEKERLLALPRDKMQQQLKSLYLGQSSRRWQRPFERGNRPPHPARPPSEGGRRGHFDERRGPGPGPTRRGPRGGPGFNGERGGRPPRDFDRDRPRRRPPEESSPSEE